MYKGESANSTKLGRWEEDSIVKNIVKVLHI